MNNMTFGEFMRWKRKASPEKYTLKDVSRKLGISLTMYSDIEMGRKKPAPNFDYEGIADMLGISHQAVCERLECVRKKISEYYEKNR